MTDPRWTPTGFCVSGFYLNKSKIGKRTPWYTAQVNKITCENRSTRQTPIGVSDKFFQFTCSHCPHEESQSQTKFLWFHIFLGNVWNAWRRRPLPCKVPDQPLKRTFPGQFYLNLDLHMICTYSTILVRSRHSDQAEHTRSFQRMFIVMTTDRSAHFVLLTCCILDLLTPSVNSTVSVSVEFSWVETEVIFFRSLRNVAEEFCTTRGYCFQPFWFPEYSWFARSVNSSPPPPNHTTSQKMKNSHGKFGLQILVTVNVAMSNEILMPLTDASQWLLT